MIEQSGKTDKPKTIREGERPVRITDTVRAPGLRFHQSSCYRAEPTATARKSRRERCKDNIAP